MRSRSLYTFTIPLIVASVFSAANFLQLYRIIDSRMYDFLLRIKPRVPENERILMLDIDDVAISNVGVFPWSRDIVADGLILMKEFDAQYAVFDIEYVEKSPRGIDDRVLKEKIPELLDREFDRIDTHISDLFRALLAGDIPMEEAGDYIAYLSEETLQSERTVLQGIQQIERDNDVYLGQAARFFGNTYFTVNMLPDPDPTVPEEARAYAAANIALGAITVDPRAVDKEQRAADIKPAILPILRGAKGAGFVNVIVDDDGVRRRIDVVMEHQGSFYPQLTFSALLDWLGNPALELKKNRLIIKNPRWPDGSGEDRAIPLDNSKSVLLHWPRGEYEESFRHLSFWKLVQHDELESRLLFNLKLMEELGYLQYHEGQTQPLDYFRYADSLREEILQGAELGLIQEYRAARDAFYKETALFLDGGAEAEILADLDQVLEAEIEESERRLYSDFRKRVPVDFAATRDIMETLTETREALASELPGSFCIIGLVGTSTTDIGVTPMVKEYMNVGIHASLINTILTGYVLDEMPLYYSLLLAFVVSFLVTLIIRNLSPIGSAITGAGVLVFVLVGTSAVFTFTGRYLNVITPLLSVLFTFIVLSLSKFFRSEKEKRFLRNAFSHYLSTDVVNQLIADPDKLNLGGEVKNLTAVFTDIRGFTGISERLDPPDLVRLLNAYLTEMSNIILDLKGTIDKYEGDAIISFFGAPVEFDDHAYRACLAAVRMKNMERHINAHFIEENLSPSPLLTRIGINTGDMIVGNMGTPQKMDYTVMGSSVNLASRLEGVNKQYGTWVLISENTRRDAGDRFTVRRLDMVRPAGFQDAVRLFELIDEKGATEDITLDAIEFFHRGLSRFESKEWKPALQNFNEAMRLLPQDGPCGIYIRRCREYMKNPPPQSWDGVFNLPMK